MTTVVVPARTVHECAAACDHLADRDDVTTVVGVAVSPPADPVAERDAGDALNVLAVRLPGLAVETAHGTGDGVDAVRVAADEHGAAEVVVAASFENGERLAEAVPIPVRVVDDAAGNRDR